MGGCLPIGNVAGRVMATGFLGLAITGGWAVAQPEAAPDIAIAESSSAVEPVILPPVESADSKISGSVNVDIASHFINYGLDTWGGGDDLFKDQTTVFAGARLNFAVAEPVVVSVGIWGEINNNGDDPLGGSIQEIDFDIGIAYTVDRFTFGVAYLDWNYASDTERFLDFSVAYDDTGLIWEDFGLYPSLVAHLRIDENGDQEVGAVAVVFGIAPAWTFNADSSYPLTLEIPLSVGLFTDEFHGGDSGVGYGSVGAVLSVPLAFISEDFGAWSASIGAIYYVTDRDVIPGNAEASFLTAQAGIAVEF